MNARDQQVPRSGAFSGSGQDTASVKASPPDMVTTAKKLLIAALSHVRTRVELLSVELAIEKTRMLSIVAAGLLAGFFAIMTFALGAVYIIANYWDTPYRLTAVGSILGAFFVATIASGIYCYYRMRVPSVLFSASAAELSKDTQALEPQG